MTEELWISFQLCDSAFPGGCLANSQGLESALYHGLVERDNHDSLYAFLVMSIEQAKSLQLPFVRTAHQICLQSGSQLPLFHKLDSYYHAIISNDIARRASINQGKCFLKAIKDTFPVLNATLNQYVTSNIVNSSGGYHSHFAPLFGLVCGLLQISLPLCDRMFLRMLMRDIVSSATRLSIIGPMKGSNIQASLIPVLEGILTEDNKEVEDFDTVTTASSDKTVSEGGDVEFYRNVLPVSSVPILEFVQSRHDMMYTRLFNT